MIARVLQKVRRLLLSPQPEPRLMSDNPRYAGYKIGRWSYGRPEVLSWNEGTVLEVGSFCSISDTAKILLGGEHRTDWVTTYPFSEFFPEAREFKGHPHTKGDVNIGHDVWIGYQALIMSGVSIGNGAVVAARSVVTKDVAPYSIVAGNPARHIRFRFDASTVEALQRMAWWDWPLAKIKAAWPFLLAPNVEDFVAEFSSETTKTVATR